MKFLLWTLALLILVLFVTAGCTDKRSDGAGGEYKDITSQELKTMIDNGEGIILLDVREKYEYDQGHLKGSLLIPIGQITGRYGELDSNKTIVVVCASGARSGEVAKFLVGQGFPKVMNLKAGIVAWRHYDLIEK